MTKSLWIMILAIVFFGCSEDSPNKQVMSEGMTTQGGSGQSAAGMTDAKGGQSESIGGQMNPSAGETAQSGGTPAAGMTAMGGEATSGGERGGQTGSGGMAGMTGGVDQPQGGVIPPAGGELNQGGSNMMMGGSSDPSAGMNAEMGGGLQPAGGQPVGPMGGNVNNPDLCPDEAFIDVGAFQGPGANYPAPSLQVSCQADTLTVRSNGIPHYTYVDQTPNGLQAQNYTWTVPLSPQYSDQTRRISCLGTVGFSISGIPVFGPNEAQMPDPYGDPVANGVMDEAEGHSGRNGTYHYHAFVEEVFFDADNDGVPNALDDEDLQQAAGPSPILGFALDGFPIYGSRGCLDRACQQVVTFKSSYEHTRYEEGTVGCQNNNACNDANAYVCAPTIIGGQETTACVYKDYAWDYNVYRQQQGEGWLDECNGRIGPDGTYRYHATSTFPYILGCYHGVMNVDHDACPTDPNAGDGGGDGGMPMNGPPQAAIDACAGSAPMAACQFQNMDGRPVAGICRIPPNSNVLACVP